MSFLGRLRRGLNLAGGGTPASFRFQSDGLATNHYSPFVDDPAFNDSYSRMRREWFPDADVDVRWRMWLLTQVARQCSQIDGAFAEFGVYRAGCAFMIFETGALAASKRFFLFDTFEGIPADQLTRSEIAADLAGAHGDTSVDYVRERLRPWADQLVFVSGDVNETLTTQETGTLAFVHMDLNASAPTRVALEYAFPRLSAGGMIVFDDYGWTGLEAQRDVIDGFVRDKAEQVIALPTGQALLVKL
jgi:O-methyltransferase